MNRAITDARVFSGLSIFLLGVLAVLALLHVSLTNDLEKHSSAHGVNTQNMLLAKELRSDVLRNFALIPILILDGTADLPEKIRDASRDFAADLQELERLNTSRADSKAVSELLRAIRESSSLLDESSEQVILLRQTLGVEAARKESEDAREIANALRDQIGDLISITEKSYEASSLTSAHIENKLQSDLVAIGIVAFLLAFATVAWIVRVSQATRLRQTEQRKKFDDQERISRARKEIVESVAHDLKNPLSALLMSIDILKEQIEELQIKDSDLLESVKISARSAAAMQSLIGDLLDHSKIESKDVALEKSESDLSDLVDQVVSLHSGLAIQKGLKLSVHEAMVENARKVSCDRMRISRVIGNLLGNAIKFTPSGGEITVGLEWTKTEARFFVRDTGTGITDEEKAHVFDRFYQVKETAKNGTGLGLAIAKGFVNAHDGKIWVESKVGVGTCFYFTLPYQPSRSVGLESGL